jgi:hypothetical protein
MDNTKKEYHKIAALLTRSLPPRYFDDETTQDGIIDALVWAHTKIAIDLEKIDEEDDKDEPRRRCSSESPKK